MNDENLITCSLALLQDTYEKLTLIEMPNIILIQATDMPIGTKIRYKNVEIKKNELELYELKAI